MYIGSFVRVIEGKYKNRLEMLLKYVRKMNALTCYGKPSHKITVHINNVTFNLCDCVYFGVNECGIVNIKYNKLQIWHIEEQNHYGYDIIKKGIIIKLVTVSLCTTTYKCNSKIYL